MVGRAGRSAVFMATVAFALFLVIEVIAGGIGLSGPDQSITLSQGGTKTSYLVVWNEGDGTETFEISFEGNISQLATASPSGFTLSSGESQKITLTYSASNGIPIGTYRGLFKATVTGTQISPSVSRPIIATVIAGSDEEMCLNRGLNLITWLGPTDSFENLDLEDVGVFKIWGREPGGGYVNAQYYVENDLWWSSDLSFEGLESGKAYFFESFSDCTIQIQQVAPPASIHLEPGLNLVGWCYDTKSFDEAFPTQSQNHAIAKIWRRLPDGFYTFSQYYPGTDTWWSSDPDFTLLERGCAYFVESTTSMEVNP